MLENPLSHLAAHALVDVHLPNSVDRAPEPRIGNYTMFVAAGRPAPPWNCAIAGRGSSSKFPLEIAQT
ncbi:hypothetical protein C6Q21_14425 [Burkholderia multivorans]|nr:hypothetical protein C6Q08_18300 [Burkholderia multivorans]PRG07869.1 hypothetical protein C6Q21_14425 [Burkholderia multivorans]PRH13668.1 hypothetical protein C6T56_28365 [Burkholderia multivorans]